LTSLSRPRRLYERIRSKRCKNVHFKELCSLLEMHDWALDRIARKNHYIYIHEDYEGVVSIPRPHRGSDVKSPYCWRALRAIQEVADYDDE